jgi:hypothetical protein
MSVLSLPGICTCSSSSAHPASAKAVRSARRWTIIHRQIGILDSEDAFRISKALALLVDEHYLP